MMTWFQSLDPNIKDAVYAVGRALLLVLTVFILVPFMIWFERRLLGWFQDRQGPDRVGNITFSRTSKFVPDFLKGKKIHMFGLLQSIADGIKLFLKEDILPNHIDKFLFVIAPSISLFVSLALAGTMPWGPWPQLTPVADVNIGLLYVIAMSSLGAYGLVLAGYASNNKYALLGALRAGAQLISYELSMSVALGCVVMATGSLKMTDMVAQQQQAFYGVVPWVQNWNIFTPFGFIAGIVFIICMIAETNRPPFDLAEAENELVAGYHTEYNTKRWGLFMMAEYMAMFVFSMIFFTVFMGGYNLLPINYIEIGKSIPALEGVMNFVQGLQNALAILVLYIKGAVGLAVYIWVRASFPRLRYDQLMTLGWKYLLPTITGNLIVISVWILVTRLYGVGAGWASAFAGVAIIVAIWKLSRQTSDDKTHLASRSITMVQGGKPQPIVVVLETEPEPAAGGVA